MLHQHIALYWQLAAVYNVFPRQHRFLGCRTRKLEQGRWGWIWIRGPPKLNGWLSCANYWSTVSGGHVVAGLTEQRHWRPGKQPIARIQKIVEKSYSHTLNRPGNNYGKSNSWSSARRRDNSRKNIKRVESIVSTTNVWVGKTTVKPFWRPTNLKPLPTTSNLRLYT